MLAGIEQVIVDERPDIVLVPGDTNSTLAGALAAAKLQMPVAHLEAGLRSFNRPMPEEINRVLTDHVSALLLCPTETAVANLRREGIVDGRAQHRRRNVRRDAVRRGAGAPLARCSSGWGSPSAPMRLPRCIAPRAPTTGDASPRSSPSCRSSARDRTGGAAAPSADAAADRARGSSISAPILACEPLGYLDMHRLLQSAVAVYTDSGGLQKEAYFHRVPCVTLRSETEWVETVAAGWNRLWKGPDYAPRREIAAYGDGHAAEQARSS